MHTVVMILSKYVFPLHVLNLNENGINKSHNGNYYDLLVSIICTGFSWKTQKSIPSKKNQFVLITKI